MCMYKSEYANECVYVSELTSVNEWVFHPLKRLTFSIIYCVYEFGKS